MTSTINAPVRGSWLTAAAATINDSPNAMITNSPCRSEKCAGAMSHSWPDPPRAAAKRSARIAASQIQLRAGGSTVAPTSTSASPTSERPAHRYTVPWLVPPRS